MSGMLKQYWWVVALRGVIAILFGFAAIVWPSSTVVILLLLFGAFAVVNGIFTLISALGPGASMDRTPLIVHGVFSIVLGILVFVWPGLTALALLYFVAIWAIIIGVLEIIAAVRLRREITNEWFLGIGGAISIIFGIICFIHPAGGILALIWLVGIYAILLGITLVALGFRLRSMRGSQAPTPQGAT